MTVVATIDSTGITVPSYDQILGALIGRFKLLFGFDIYIEPDAQDLQMLAIFAKAIHDSNLMAAAVYNAFSPATAVGAGLSSLVKINGLRRKIATYSSVVLTLEGQAGIVLDNAAATDDLGNVWLLPTQVVMPITATIDVTATARDAGAITAAPGTITGKYTSFPGWDSVTNAQAAVPGAEVESDAELRRRQAQSTAISAQSPVAAIWAGLLDLDGVTRVAVHHNDQDVPDVNGIPGHSIAPVIEGGDAAEIAAVIANTKGPGTGTFGSTTVVATDSHGIPNVINFFVLETVPIYFRVSIRPLNGYLAAYEALILQSLANHFNELNIGEPVYHNRLWAAANLSGGAAMRGTGMGQSVLDAISDTYNVTMIEISLNGVHYSLNDLQIPFNAAAVSTVSDGELILDTTIPVAPPGGVAFIP